MGGQPRPVGAKGVGLDNLGPCADVVQVDRLHQLGVRQIELIQATVKGYSSPLVELGTHSPIAQDGAATQPLYKPFRHFFFNSFLPTLPPPICFFATITGGHTDR